MSVPISYVSARHKQITTCYFPNMVPELSLRSTFRTPRVVVRIMSFGSSKFCVMGFPWRHVILSLLFEQVYLRGVPCGVCAVPQNPIFRAKHSSLSGFGTQAPCPEIHPPREGLHVEGEFAAPRNPNMHPGSEFLKLRALNLTPHKDMVSSVATSLAFGKTLHFQ